MTESNDSPRRENEKTVSITTDSVSSMNCAKCDARIDLTGLEAFAEIACPQCGHHAQVPAQLGQFRLLRLLGTGGMGGVYHAYDETLGRNVAIKVMLESLGSDSDFVETFKREAQAVAKLNHPHIAQIYSFGQEKGQPYIVMELVNGRHMDKMIEEEPALDQALVLRIALEVAGGLAAADEIGLIHGDIKPENILLDDKGSSKLVDFGLATFAHQGKQEGIWGTPYYIAPEKVRRQRIDARSDIYSLGATLFHALTGRPPFEGETPVEVVKARLTEPAPALASLREDANPDVARIVARMLEAEPGRRYPTYASLISDLTKTLEKLGPGKAAGQAVRGKKVVIRKKGARAPGAPAVAASGTPKSGKIVVSRGAAAFGTSSLPPAEPGKPAARKPEGDKAPRKRSKAPLVMLIILILLALAGGGVYFGLVTLKKKAQQALVAAQAKAIEALHEQGAGLCDKAEAELATLVQLEAQAMAFYRTAATNVLAVEDRALAAPQPPPEPEPEPSAAPPDTNAVAAAAAEPGAAASAEPAPDAEPGPDAQPDTVAEPEPATEGTGATESLIMATGKRVVEACEQVMAARARAGQLVDQAKALAEALQTNRAILTATAQVAEIETLLEPLPGITLAAREALARAKESAEKTDDIRKREEEVRRQQRAEAARAAREAAAREAAAREAAARQARIDDERQRARTAEAAVRELVRGYLYSDAAEQLKRDAGTYQTEEGRAAILTAAERYERLESMKGFFIKRLTDAPFSFGYLDGPSTVDILSASRVGLRLKDRLVPWREVSTRQMLAFIKHYVTDEALTEGVKLRELANQNLNAAIFCAINGGYAAAEVYARAAVNLLPTMQEDVKRLVPPPPATGVE